jgi:hypothetical protein
MRSVIVSDTRIPNNATKYGALSLPDKGQVDIRWSIDGGAAESEAAQIGVDQKLFASAARPAPKTDS